MAKFVTIGERLSVTAPTVNKAFAARDEEPILSWMLVPFTLM